MFCIAPWTHTYVSPQGERRLCCASREKHSFTRQYIDQFGPEQSSTFSPQTLEEHWNSDFMKHVRKSLLKGETIPECSVCTEQILNLYTYRDYFTKTLFPHLVEKVKKTTDEDGYTSMIPVSYDYRISNQCNFKCRMCGEQLSSAWEAEKRQYNQWDEQRDSWMLPSNREQIEVFRKEILIKELESAVRDKTIEEIYWVGGEPVIWEEHWSLMDELIASGHSKNVFCRYNTNLAIIERNGKNLFHDILPYFKDYNICASIDATGNVGEYIRSGLCWDKWLENFKVGLPYIKERGDDSLVMDITLTLPGLFDLRNLIEVAHKLNVKIYVKIIFAFDSSILLSPYALPRPILHRILDDLITDLSPKVNDKTVVIIETLEAMKRRNTFEEEYDDYREGFIRGRERLLELEQMRATKTNLEEIFSANEEVLAWWKN